MKRASTLSEDIEKVLTGCPSHHEVMLARRLMQSIGDGEEEDKTGTLSTTGMTIMRKTPTVRKPKVVDNSGKEMDQADLILSGPSSPIIDVVWLNQLFSKVKKDV